MEAPGGDHSVMGNASRGKGSEAEGRGRAERAKQAVGSRHACYSMHRKGRPANAEVRHLGFMWCRARFPARQPSMPGLTPQSYRVRYPCPQVS